MKRLTQIIVTIVFLAYITGPLLSFSVGVRASEIENRPLAAFPTISFRTLADGTAFYDLQGYLSDRLPLREVAIRAGASVDYWIFGRSPNPSKALVGNDRWLFLRSTFDDACEPDVDPTAVAADMRVIADAFEAHGIPFAFVIAPDKLSIHPEGMTDELEELAQCNITARDRLLAELRSEPPHGWIDTWSLLADAATPGSNDHYFRYDSHLTPLGSALWVEAVVEHFSPGIWNDDHLQEIGEVAHVGNVTRLMGLDFAERVTWHELHRPGITSRKTAEFGESFSPGSLASKRYQATSHGEQPALGDLVMLNDSFIDIAEPMVAQFFGSSAMADWRDETSIEIWLDELTDAEFVIMQTAEHNLWSRLGDGSLASEIIEHLEDS